MGLSRYKLGELIEPILETNSNLLYGADDVRGMTITKEIIPTKADLVGADLSKFLVVKPNEFIYNPRTHGKKIGFGYNNTNDTFIISWNNIAFKIKSSMNSIILSDYLFLHFNRNEWDRYACFQSWGSSTEVFSWESLCDMDIQLPPLEIQQRFVDIYTALVANAKSYEKGLEDLKLTFEAIINEYKRKATKKAVSSILREIDYRNIDGSVKDVQGINIAKQFMPSVANVYDIKLSKYKLVQRGQFAFSGMQTGRDECIRIALYNGKNPIIISPAYAVLEIKDDEVLAEYVMIWFSRKEIDRLGWFMSDSSIRTNLDMERFYEIQIPIPKMEIQRSIVDIYNAYIARKSLCENLKSQIKAICPVLIQGSLKEGAK